MVKNKQSNAWVAPFWHIQRHKERSKCNCAMAMLSTNSIITIGAVGDLLKLDEPVVVSDVQGEIPVCTNFAALAAGEELVLFKDTAAIGKPKGKPQKAARTWMQEKDAMSRAHGAKKQRQGL